MSCIKNNKEIIDSSLQDLRDALSNYASLINVEIDSNVNSFFTYAQSARMSSELNRNVNVDLRFFSIHSVNKLINDIKSFEKQKYQLDVFKNRINISPNLKDAVEQVMIIEKLEFGDSYIKERGIDE